VPLEYVPVLVPVVALLSLWATIYINRRKHRLDLYARINPIYEAAQRLMTHVLSKGHCDTAELAAFDNATLSAPHLLELDLLELLREMSLRALKIDTARA